MGQWGLFYKKIFKGYFILMSKVITNDIFFIESIYTFKKDG